jgi:hypothetical protein
MEKKGKTKKERKDYGIKRRGGWGKLKCSKTEKTQFFSKIVRLGGV